MIKNDCFVYRKAEVKDLDEIAYLVTKLIGTCNFINKSKINKPFLQILEINKQSISQDIKRYLVCEYNNKVIGACGLSKILTKNNYGLAIGKYREILYLIVDEKYQKMGIGTKLLKQCCENCKFPILYEAWGDNGKYVNSKFILEKLNFNLVKDLGNKYYKNNGYCTYCVNRDKKCNSCLAEVWIKV